MCANNDCIDSDIPSYPELAFFVKTHRLCDRHVIRCRVECGVRVNGKALSRWRERGRREGRDLECYPARTVSCRATVDVLGTRFIPNRKRRILNRRTRYSYSPMMTANEMTRMSNHLSRSGMGHWTM